MKKQSTFLSTEELGSKVREMFPYAHFFLLWSEIFVSTSYFLGFKWFLFSSQKIKPVPNGPISGVVRGTCQGACTAHVHAYIPDLLGFPSAPPLPHHI